jgi:DNA polymerase-3 subunit epsilon
MRLERPLVFFDLETTGLDVEKDRVIEFAAIKVFPDKRKERFESFVNPERPVPAEITKLTGITDAMVAEAPVFRDLTSPIQNLIKDADLAGYNISNFDVPMLEAEFKRSGQSLPGPFDRAIVDPLEILKKQEVRTLSWAYAFYLGQERKEGHRSMEDTEATMEVLRAQIKQYDLTGTPIELQTEIRHPFLDSGKRFKLEGDSVLVNFGKYRGKALAFIKKTDPDYVSWMRENLGPEIARVLDRY